MPSRAILDKYRVPSTSQESLDSLVDRIEANPGDLIRPGEFDEALCSLNMRAVLANLPEGVSEDDFVGILKLALLTECATESYANVISSIGNEFGATWLSRFTQRVWAPDEITHHTPYRLMLLDLGFSCEELDREIKDTQEKQYLHTGARTPVNITTFGMIQEYLTDSYHGLIAGMLRKSAPEAAHMVFRVKRRETLHAAWYRDMTAIQVESNPRFVEDIVSEIMTFDMPGASLVPELQAEGKRWQLLMGINVEQVFRDLIRLMHEIFGSTRLTGEMAMMLAAERDVKLGPLKASQVSAALNRLGGAGYGLIGEALLERVGLGYVFKSPAGRQDSGYRVYSGIQERVRSLFRSWISTQIPAPSAVMLGT